MRNLKKVLSLVLAMAMAMSLAVSAGAAFADADQISDEYAVAVEFAAQTGILEGVGNNNYAPQNNLTRAQLATMTYRIATGDVEDKYTDDFAGGAAEVFTDVAATDWAAGYIGYAADAGYLKGCGEDLYKPNSALTGYQALAAFLRVVGYNEPGQFTGPDWTKQVAMIATEAGVLEDITGVDLNKAITREVAAQILYNILFSDLVSYTPAFGYQAWGDDCLAEEVFDIDTAKAGVDGVATAPWGQPAVEWYYNDGDVAVSIAYAPVAEYTVAVTECDMAKDLGLKKDGAVAQNGVFQNGKMVSRGDVFGSEKAITLDATKDVTVGAQGTLTEIYLVDGEYWCIQIETMLGQITETKAAKFDANGHETEAATAKLDVFECGTHDKTVTIETDEFAKDDYVLVNYSFMIDDEDGKPYGFYLTETAPVATAKVNEIDRADKQTTIGGKTYDWAKHYHKGNPANDLETYNVFVDFYGNLIGLVKPAAADPVYTILEDGIWTTNGYDSVVNGKLLNLATEALDVIDICSYTVGTQAVNKFTYWNDKVATPVHSIVKYVECEDGYELTKVGQESYGYRIVKGAASIKNVHGFNIATADAETVFAIETECGVYDVVTGYANVATMNSVAGKIAVLDEDSDGFADLIYVDAKSALFAGEEIFAYVMPGCTDIGGGELENGVAYDIVADVVVGGEIVKVLVQDGKQYAVTGKAGFPVTLKTDANGLVYAAEVVAMIPGTVGAVSGDTVKMVDAYGFLGTGYTVTANSTVWVINTDGTVEIGAAADFEKDNNVLFTLFDGTTNFDTVILKK